MDDSFDSVCVAWQDSGRADPRLRAQLVTLVDPWIERAIRRETRAFGRDHATREDLTQSVRLLVFRDLGTFRGSTTGQLVRWVETVAKHCVVRAVRRERAICRRGSSEVAADGDPSDPLARLCDGGPTPDERLAVRDLLDRVRERLDELPRRDREAILWICLCGASHRHLAARLGVSEQAARKILSRARARLSASVEVA